MRPPGRHCRRKLLRAFSRAAITGMILGAASCTTSSSSKDATPSPKPAETQFPCPSDLPAGSPTVMNGPVFNDPKTGNNGASIFKQFISLTKSVPSGGSIWLAIHQIDNSSSSPHVTKRAKCISIENKLFASLASAVKRQVKVHILVDGQVPIQSNRAYKKLSKYINGHSGSWLHYCPGTAKSPRGCIGKSLDHNKYALFSQVKTNGKTYKNVIFQSSSNLTDYYLAHSYNDSYTLSDTKGKLYHAYQKAFQDMDSARSKYKHPDQVTGIYWSHLDDYFWTALDATSTYKAYFYPLGHNSHPSTGDQDPILNDLNKVRCHYTSNGTSMVTTIRIAMLGFTAGRKDIANKLVSLAKSGCSVNILYYNGPNGSGDPTVDSTIHKILIDQNTKNPSPNPTDTRNPSPGYKYGVQAVPCTNKIPTLHTKIMMIDGIVNNKVQQIVYTGSDNFTTLTNSDDTTLRIAGNKIHQQYLKWINNMHEVCAYQGGPPPPGIRPTS